MEDIEDIIHYPGSRRTFYMRQKSGMLLIYHNPCESIQAINFYQTSMTAKGWKVDRYMGSVSNSKASASICFYKKDRRCIINVSPYKYGSHALIIHQETGSQLPHD